MTTLVLIIAYIIIGLIVKYVMDMDLVKTVSTYLTNNEGYTCDVEFHNGTKESYKSVDLDSDNEIVTGAVEQELCDNFENSWKNHTMISIIATVLWLTLWPIIMPLAVYLYRNHTKVFIDDVLLIRD